MRTMLSCPQWQSLHEIRPLMVGASWYMAEFYLCVWLAV